jgi:hypothetical protein
MTITKEQLVFDSTSPDSTDNIGAFVRSSDGTLITHTSNGSKKELDVHVDGVATDAKLDQTNISLSNIDSKMPGSLLSNIQFDEIQVEYPVNNIERYKYYLNNVLSTTIEITYVDSTKRVLTRVRKI